MGRLTARSADDVEPAQLALFRGFYLVGTSPRRFTLHVNAHGFDRDTVENTVRDVAFGMSHVQSSDVTWQRLQVFYPNGFPWFVTDPIESAGQLDESAYPHPGLALEVQFLTSSGKRARHRMYGIPGSVTTEFGGSPISGFGPGWFSQHVGDHGFTATGRRYITPGRLAWVSYKGTMVTSHRRPLDFERAAKFLWSHGVDQFDNPDA